MLAMHICRSNCVTCASKQDYSSFNNRPLWLANTSKTVYILYQLGGSRNKYTIYALYHKKTPRRAELARLQTISEVFRNAAEETATPGLHQREGREECGSAGVD